MNFKVLINGELFESNEKMEIMNPSTLTVAGTVPLISSQSFIDEVVSNAKLAYHLWKKTSFETRATYLVKFRDLLLKNKQNLADLLVLEIAKNKKESLAEIERSIEYITQTLSIYKELNDNPLIIDKNIHGIKDKVGKFVREPLGVILAIPPFNYPVNLLISKLAPALISGNTVIYKPATQGSLVGAKISELCYQAGFPQGVVNCITGYGKDIGDLLVKHHGIAMISFTGSADIGNRIATLANRIPLVLELGGKDPAIVLSDADLEKTAKEIVKGSLSYNGQRCTAIKRVLVVPEVHDKLTSLILKEVKNLTVGLANYNTDITPLISMKSAEYVKELVNDAIKFHHAKPLTEIVFNKNLVHPIVLDEVSLESRIAWEEPFGPVIPIIICKDFKECIEVANKSEYGLQASIFTKNTRLAEEIAKELDCGTVNINSAPSRGPDIFPFLGVKNSGFNTQGLFEAILSMTRFKGIVKNK